MVTARCVGTIALAAFLAACAPVVPAPQQQLSVQASDGSLGPSVVGLSLGAATQNQARLNFEATAAKAYVLQQTGTVHRWVANDIVAYEVAFKRQTGPNEYESAGYAQVSVPMKGAQAKTTAVFTRVPWGAVYRAFVVAKGNPGGDEAQPLQVLNDVAATADFDFSQSQDQASSISKTVQVVFNAVAFSGTGSIGFQAPNAGDYANPQGEIQATATTLP